MVRTPSLTAFSLALASAALAEDLRVDPDTGNNTFTAVFDAKLGERITAQSAAVACDLRYEEKTGLASGRCSVPLTSIKVDNEDTKTEHFQQWVTNKKTDPGECRFVASFDRVKIGALAPERPVSFTGEIPFTVCGRAPIDGRKEKVNGTAFLFPAGAYGDKKTVRIRATIAGFDRDAYQIGPKHTEGWLARVQSLAQVVAEEGTIELSLFATADGAESARK
ncbi:hypothetical protein [Anaeromyxobacter sp. Fw109-5]|uniref:hypothetical protein n=1 Tax=Anaeromyxobacter sp. (strain Fw109-5) TaxID=404589 RepID=UPI000158A718|nr:hypothetical protein [Anaeromyxobacter sp. Fw109-5]ABS25764.1 hypothetical protein Anae109_1560 [Anaeromyxobacter sp. Fw109-5]